MAKFTIGKKLKTIINPTNKSKKEKIENEKPDYVNEQSSISLAELEKTNEIIEQVQQTEIEKEKSSALAHKEFRYNYSLKCYEKAMEATKYVRDDMKEEWINLLNKRRDTLSIEQYIDSKLDELTFVADALEAQANGESIEATRKIEDKLKLQANETFIQVDYQILLKKL